MSLEQGQIHLMKYWIFLSQSEILFVRDSTEIWLWLPLKCQQQVIQGDDIATLPVGPSSSKFYGL